MVGDCSQESLDRPPPPEFLPSMVASALRAVARGAQNDLILVSPPPLLVVEVTSPSTRDIEWGPKRIEYGARGAGGYWIVDPEAGTVTLLEPRSGQMVEVQTIASEAMTSGPVAVWLDAAALTG